MMDSQSALEQLILSKEFDRLQKMERRFNLFQALHIRRKELPHSNLLAFFLTPYETHGCGDRILRQFMRCIFAADTDRQRLPLDELLKLRYEDVRVYREYSHIDLLIDFPRSKSVFGIEHKIDHDERGQQLADYQKTINSEFPKYKTRHMVFLTPSGRTATSGSSSSPVSCVSISYRCVIEALQAGVEICTDDGARNFLTASIQHIKEDIMGNDDETQLIRELWSNPDYQHVLQAICNKRPVLQDIESEYEKRVTALIKKELGACAEFRYYPKRGPRNEIKFHVDKWRNNGIPITFVFYMYSYFPAVRVLVHQDDFPANQGTLKKLATCGPGVIDPDFSPISDWRAWRRIFSEEDYPDGSYIKNLSFSKEVVDIALAMIKRNLNDLKGIVECSLSDGDANSST